MMIRTEQQSIKIYEIKVAEMISKRQKILYICIT